MAFLSQFDAFHDMAAKATGLDDFGAADYREPMRLLLADFDRHTRFGALGVEMASAEIVGHLAGLLMAQQGFKTHPDFVQMPLARPLIVTGMTRTGSTVLQRLLAQDPAAQSLPLWLGAMPMPRPPRDTWERNPVYQQVKQGLEQFLTLVPTIQQIHPMAADGTDECRNGIDHSFWSVTFSTCADVPDYTAWVLEGDARYAYRWYRRALALIAAGDARRWVLKDPSHMFGLDAMLDVFPDACVVQTHRDPLTALTSVASLTYGIRRVREPSLTPVEHGKTMLANFPRALDKTERVRRRHDPAQFFDVHMNELHADPLGTLERIYRHFDLPVSAEARMAWSTRVQSDPTSGHGEHHYRPEEFGFSRDIVDAAIGEYAERYASVERTMRMRR